MRVQIELFAVGLLASVFGSTVGLGGGFILVPVLRLFFGLDPADAAGTSLAMVAANSASGAIMYLLQRRVHVTVGFLVAAGTLPGSILGALVVRNVSDAVFDSIFAVFLLIVSGDILLKRLKGPTKRRKSDNPQSTHGMSHRAAVLVGLFVGFISSTFGIGGGVALVPAFLYFSELPAHAISATSHFAIALTAPIGLAAHAVQHNIAPSDVVPLVLGGLLGGPLGARFSLSLKAPSLLILVGLALGIAGISLIVRHIHFG